MTFGRHAGLVLLLALLMGGGVLAVLPGGAAGVRLGGVGLLWWYALLAAPVAAGAIAVVTLGLTGGARRSDPVGAWVGPAVVVALAAHVFSGDTDAPVLVLAAALAPLLAMAGSRAPLTASHALADLLLAASLGLVLWANFAVAGDLATVLAGGRAPGVVLAALAAAAAMVVGAGVRWRTAVTAGGVTALVLPLVGLGTAVGGPPWATWSGLAASPALVFAEESPWVSDGVTVRHSTTIVFSEPHRVTAMSEGVFRVVEHDGGEVTVRHWRLGRGAALNLRSGDELALEPGVRVGFEAGKRVPGAAMSGIAWADPVERRPARALLGFVAIGVTLLGGAAALAAPGVGPRWLGPVAGPPALVVAVVAAACWGLYAAARPDLGLAAPSVAPLVRLPLALLPTSLGVTVLVVTLLGLTALLMATAASLRERFVRAEGRRGRPERFREVLWGVLIAAAALAALTPVDPWRLVILGLGLGASALVAPALAGGGVAHPGAVLAGAAVFGLVLAGPAVTGLGSVVTDYPAVVAAPVAWGVGTIVRRR